MNIDLANENLRRHGLPTIGAIDGLEIQDIHLDIEQPSEVRHMLPPAMPVAYWVDEDGEHTLTQDQFDQAIEAWLLASKEWDRTHGMVRVMTGPKTATATLRFIGGRLVMRALAGDDHWHVDEMTCGYWPTGAWERLERSGWPAGDKVEVTP